MSTAEQVGILLTILGTASFLTGLMAFFGLGMFRHFPKLGRDISGFVCFLLTMVFLGTLWLLPI